MTNRREISGFGPYDESDFSGKFAMICPHCSRVWTSTVQDLTLNPSLCGKVAPTFATARVPTSCWRNFILANGTDIESHTATATWKTGGLILDVVALSRTLEWKPFETLAL